MSFQRHRTPLLSLLKAEERIGIAPVDHADLGASS